MKRIIMKALALVMLLASLGGCWIGWDEGGRQDRDSRQDQDSRQDRGGGSEGPRSHAGPGGAGGGH